MISLYQGDCAEILKTMPDKSIDLIITDPPYDQKQGGQGGAFGYKNRIYRVDVDPMSQGYDMSVLDDLVRVMKHINLYIWCNKEQLPLYFSYFGQYKCRFDLLTWHKTNPIPTCNGKYLPDTEYLLFVKEPGVKLYGNYKTKRKYYVSPQNKEDKKKYGHPTVKPYEIIHNLVVNSSVEGDTVLDPFMGSGTTGAVCKALGRDFIGVEISPKYFDMAKNRIEGVRYAEEKEKGQAKVFYTRSGKMDS